MSHRDEMNRILQEVSQWPTEDRMRLAVEISIGTSSQIAPPPRNTLSGAIGLLKTGKPAPTDAEVKDEYYDHLAKKHG